MGWNPDRPPLEYLERRLKYYKKRVRLFKMRLRAPPSRGEVNFFGSKKKWCEAVNRTIAKSELRVHEFTEAISKLK